MMVAETYDAAMVRVFADEGGYTNDPKDPGGATNWGITIYDARKYWLPNATPADVRAMPKSVASEIYRKHYADPILYDQLPAGADYSELDAAINSGIGRAIPWMGKAAGANVAVTTAAVALAHANNAPDKVALIQRYWQIRLSFLHGLRTWSHFGPGWGKRCANGEAAAVRMWLTVGAKLPQTEARSRMDHESSKAKTQAKKSTGAATGSAAGPATVPAFDLSHLSLGGKIVLGIAVAVLVAALIYFIRQAIIHNQRAAAYAAS